MKKDKKSVDLRHQNILKYVRENGEVRSEDIAEMFGISLMTVRRDLQLLARKGLLHRTHGGAATIDAFYNTRKLSAEVNSCRDSISEFAASFVNDGDTVFINGSQTALNLLRFVGNKKVHVVTNNGWCIGADYQDGVTIQMTGGDLRGRILIGEHTLQSLLEETADKTFIGCAAVYEDAEFVYDIPTEIGINEVMITKTRQHVYILADHTKLHFREDRSSSYGSCTYDCEHTLITDELADPVIIDRLRQNGTDIIVVPIRREQLI
ncbi:MAG: DeoR/GlpR family DNA-binding transcription regulator [Oscillospiraceae bacterium]|nr:DeoR/GlpR family DNA-binding transcription regulator [Oscillospiraceae bacterium]